MNATKPTRLDCSFFPTSPRYHATSPSHPIPSHHVRTSTPLTNSPPNLLISATTAILLTLISMAVSPSFSPLTFTGKLFHPALTFHARWPVASGFHNPTIRSSSSGSQNHRTASP